MHLRSTLTCCLQVDARIPFTTPLDCSGPTLAAVFRRQFLRVAPCNSIEIVLQWNAASLPLSSRCAGIDPSPLELAVRVVVQPTLDVVGGAAPVRFSPTASQAHWHRRRLPRCNWLVLGAPEAASAESAVATDACEASDDSLVALQMQKLSWAWTAPGQARNEKKVGTDRMNNRRRC